MNYKEKYEQALERARKNYEKNIEQGWTCDKVIYEEIFPELKENGVEDDRIRKEIVEYIKIQQRVIKDEGHIQQATNIKKWLVWLEKQGESKSYSWKPTKEQFEALDYAYNCCPDSERGNYYEGVLKTLIDDLYRLEKQGEKSNTHKFKVGDWIINNNKRLAVPTQILEIEKYGYVTSRGYTSFDKVKTDYHLWTIEDAKDGDVLAFDNDTIVIFKDLYNSSTFHSYCHIEDGLFDVSKDDMPDWWEGEDFHPVTKEQRDLLFQKMKEAGYVWDTENKELKKIEPVSTWNEKIKGLNELETYILSLVPDRSLDAIKVDAKNIRHIINKEQPAEWSRQSIIGALTKWLTEKIAPLHKKSLDGTINEREEMFKAALLEMRSFVNSPGFQIGKDTSVEWSEEDEYLYNWCMSAIQTRYNDGLFTQSEYNRTKSWLKSIKDRVQPQPKQEWSEYDKIQLSEAIQMIEANGTWIRSEDAVKQVSDWLKSLKPNHWKPSEYDISLLEELARNIRNNVRPFCSEVSALEELIKNIKNI